MLKIFGFPTFNLGKVLITAEELALNYEYVPLDPTRGEHKSPEHLKRHPGGKIPAIEHDGRPLFESAAIARYFANISKSDLYPEDPYKRAQVDQWLDYSVSHVGRWFSVYFWEKIIQKRYFAKDPNLEALKEADRFLAQHLPVLEKQLEKNTFLAHDNFSLADIFAFCHIDTHKETGIDISHYPQLSHWYQNINARKSILAYRKILKH